MSFFCLLFIFLVSKAATAEEISFSPRTNIQDCSNIDLRFSAPTEVREFFQKPRDMGDIGWCYAYASADLISWKINQPISGLALAISYVDSLNSLEQLVRRGVGHFNHSSEYIYEGGFATQALKLAKRQGVCPLTAVEDHGPAFTVFASKINSFIQKRDSQQIQNLIRSASEYFKSLDSTSITQILLDESLKTSAEILIRLNQKSCEEKLIPLISDFEFFYSDAGFENLIDKIDSIITGAHARPVAVLLNDRHIGRGGSGFHYMTVIGRRFDNRSRQCLYVMRDNKGPECRNYYFKNVRCEEGHVLLSERELFDISSHIVYLNP